MHCPTSKFYYDIYEDNKSLKDDITMAPKPFPGYILIHNTETFP